MNRNWEPQGPHSAGLCLSSILVEIFHSAKICQDAEC